MNPYERTRAMEHLRNKIAKAAWDGAIVAAQRAGMLNTQSVVSWGGLSEASRKNLEETVAEPIMALIVKR